jgi:chloramphenicol 3-O phosphotransferase
MVTGARGHDRRVQRRCRSGSRLRHQRRVGDLQELPIRSARRREIRQSVLVEAGNESNSGRPTDPPTGSVIVLNGPSSSGKTTLARALQRRFAADGTCWFVYAMDDYFAKVPPEWVTAGKHIGAYAEQGVVLETVDGAFRMRLGPIGRQVLAAWRGAVGSAVRAGLNVIADDVILAKEEWNAWQVELDGLDTHWVRVHIALDILEARELARGDRIPGHARAQYEDSYRYATYDAEVDTGKLDPERAADAVIRAWRAKGPGGAP